LISLAPTACADTANGVAAVCAGTIEVRRSELIARRGERQLKPPMVAANRKPANDNRKPKEKSHDY
jgi:hypothetical protein